MLLKIICLITNININPHKNSLESMHELGILENLNYQTKNLIE